MRQSPKNQILNVILFTIHCLDHWDLYIGYCLLFDACDLKFVCLPCKGVCDRIGVI